LRAQASETTRTAESAEACKTAVTAVTAMTTVTSSRPQLYVDANHYSPYAMSAYVALVEKGVAFDLAHVDLAAGATRAADYAAVSATRRVPTLVHEGFALSESSAIDEYVDEVFPGPPIYPRAPRERARARQVQAWLRSDLMPIREERTTAFVFSRPVPTPLSPAALAAADTLFAAAAAWLAHGGPNLAGDDWCIADADLALMLNRLVLPGDAVPAPLADYATRQWARPSVQRWVAMAARPT
jgi:glutathione S-transferase